jgi:hypothetical protein
MNIQEKKAYLISGILQRNLSLKRLAFVLWRKEIVFVNGKEE